MQDAHGPMICTVCGATPTRICSDKHSLCVDHERIVRKMIRNRPGITFDSAVAMEQVCQELSLHVTRGGAV